MALIEKLKAIANAIRNRTDKTDELTLDQMVLEISDIGKDRYQTINFYNLINEYIETALREYSILEITNSNISNIKLYINDLEQSNLITSLPINININDVLKWQIVRHKPINQASLTLKLKLK